MPESSEPGVLHSFSDARDRQRAEAIDIVCRNLRYRGVVLRQPTFLFRLIAWVTVLSIVAAAPRLQAQSGVAARHHAEACALSSASCSNGTLLGTHTFEANPSPVACPLRSLDTPIFSTTPDAVVAAPPRILTRRRVACRLARHARATLVGIVELRI